MTHSTTDRMKVLQACKLAAKQGDSFVMLASVAEGLTKDGLLRKTKPRGQSPLYWLTEDGEAVLAGARRLVAHG